MARDGREARRALRKAAWRAAIYVDDEAAAKALQDAFAAVRTPWQEPLIDSNETAQERMRLASMWGLRGLPT